MNAMDKGMMAAAVTPLSSRRPASVASEPAEGRGIGGGRRQEAGERYDGVLAEAVADRPPEQLAQAISEGEGGDGVGSGYVQRVVTGLARRGAAVDRAGLAGRPCRGHRGRSGGCARAYRG